MKKETQAKLVRLAETSSKGKVNMKDPALLKALLAFAKKNITEKLNSSSRDVSKLQIRIEPHEQNIHATIFYVVVSFEANEFSPILALDDYGSADDPQYATKINGQTWLLGDGDDTGAVQFKGGKFYIWLRNFGE